MQQNLSPFIASSELITHSLSKALRLFDDTDLEINKLKKKKHLKVFTDIDCEHLSWQYTLISHLRL